MQNFAHLDQNRRQFWKVSRKPREFLIKLSEENWLFHTFLLNTFGFLPLLRKYIPLEGNASFLQQWSDGEVPTSPSRRYWICRIFRLRWGPAEVCFLCIGAARGNIGKVHHPLKCKNCCKNFLIFEGFIFSNNISKDFPFSHKFPNNCVLRPNGRKLNSLWNFFKNSLK